MSCMYRKAHVVEKDIELKEWTFGPGMQTNYITAWTNSNDGSTSPTLYLNTIAQQDRRIAATMWERILNVAMSFFKEIFILKFMTGGK